MAEFRKATNELKRTVNTELALDETPGPPQLHSRRLEVELPSLGLGMEPPVEPPPLTEARTASATFATSASFASSASSATVPVAEPDIVPVAVPSDLADPHRDPH